MSATPSKFSFTEAEYVRLALRTMLAVPFCIAGLRTMLAGECPLCGAERLEDGAPAPHRRYAVEVQRYYRPSWRR